ncbi:MAG: hypothetical protein KA715_03475 [Xanthomonadaceae bacterium]|nr:hypothetical protein [Xanthomonadaceae bacterium]
MKNIILLITGLVSLNSFAQEISWEAAVDGRFYFSDEHAKIVKSRIKIGEIYTNGYSADMVGMYQDLGMSDKNCPTADPGAFKFRVISFEKIQLHVVTSNEIDYVSGSGKGVPVLGSKPTLTYIKAEVIEVPANSCVKVGTVVLLEDDYLAAIK